MRAKEQPSSAQFPILTDSMLQSKRVTPLSCENAKPPLWIVQSKNLTCDKPAYANRQRSSRQFEKFVSRTVQSSKSVPLTRQAVKRQSAKVDPVQSTSSGRSWNETRSKYDCLKKPSGKPFRTALSYRFWSIHFSGVSASTFHSGYFCALPRLNGEGSSICLT